MFNIFYFSNPIMYVMYVRKKIFNVFSYFYFPKLVFRNKIKIYNRKMRLIFFLNFPKSFFRKKLKIYNAK